MTPFQNNCSDFEKIILHSKLVSPKNPRAKRAGKSGFQGKPLKADHLGTLESVRFWGEENPDPNSDFNFKENWEIRSPKELDDFELNKEGYFYIPGTVCG